MSALSDEMGKDWCVVLLSFYMFTGEDGTSAFKRERQSGSTEENYEDFTFSCLIQVFFYFCFL